MNIWRQFTLKHKYQQLCWYLWDLPVVPVVNLNIIVSESFTVGDEQQKLEPTQSQTADFYERTSQTGRIPEAFVTGCNKTRQLPCFVLFSLVARSPEVGSFHKFTVGEDELIADACKDDCNCNHSSLSADLEVS